LNLKSLLAHFEPKATEIILILIEDKLRRRLMAIFFF